LVDHTIAILTRVALAFGLAVAGGVFSATVGLTHARLCALISLAAGTLLGVTGFLILPEAAETMRWWELVLALGSGYAVFSVISKYVYHVCPACAASHFDESTTHRFSEIASALIVALAVHSTMDGLALAAGHEAGHGVDAAMVVAVCAHKVPEGLALGALLLGAGLARGRVISWVAAVEATTILGGVIGLVVLPGTAAEHVPFWLGAVLAHVGGGFIYLATHAVLGEMVKHGKRTVLLSFSAGVAVIGLLSLFAHG
jgi:ZIP family zinc transporter